jgi:Tfp pilus assembly protein FimT
MKNKAYTTIELLMVMVIIGFFASVVLPAFSGSYATLKIEGAYKQMMQDIRYAQQLAISRQVTHGVSFNPINDAYFVYRQTTSNIVKDPATQKSLSVTYASGIFSGIDLVSTTFVFPSNRLEFNSLGEPSSGGTITLNYGGTQGCGGPSGGITRTITVEANTGRLQ